MSEGSSTAGAPGPEGEEARWLAETYQPQALNLSVRGVVVGALLGAGLCVSNLYVFLRTGWSMGVTLTACIVAAVIFRVLAVLRLSRRPLGALENNALTTVASGAGYMTGGGNAAAFGALLMVTTVRPPGAPMVAWLALIAALGVFAAIPIKRQLINKEALRFPTGTATAETIRTLHGEGAGGGSAAAAWLGGAGLLGAVLAWVRDAWHLVPDAVGLPVLLAGRRLAEWTLALKVEVVLLGGGALMSFRICWSMLLAAGLAYGVLAPRLVAEGVVAQVSYKAIVAWTLWPGAAILVASGLTSFALDFRSIGRALSGLTRLGRAGPAVAGLAAVECPDWWFPAGFLALAPVVVALMSWLFGVPWWAGALAVPLAVVMGFVAARVTGDTDVTPTKALGPVTQLIFGALTPGNLAGNIMVANVTGGIGLHAADLLTTLKTGWLLGAKPRHQVAAQLVGVLVGSLVVIPAFSLMVPDASALGGEEWPAPSCVVWAGVSRAFVQGLDALPPSARSAILAGALLGVALVLLERFAPPRLRAFLPSASGLGIALVIPGSNSISMFLGAAVAEVLRRAWPKVAERTVVPVASGLIAGESLVGALVAMLKSAGVLPR